VFAEHMYGIAHCLIDRDGRVIGCNLPIGNGPLLEQAPAMNAPVRELMALVIASHGVVGYAPTPINLRFDLSRDGQG
jgi:hypothetical protein